MYANYLKKLLINAGITSYSSEGIEADIYSNYKYTIDDLKKVYEYILGNVELTPEEFAFLDANGDVKINVQDMILIERDGGLYNISDSQPGKFKITTHNANENIQIFDKDGNPIISTGIVSLISSPLIKATTLMSVVPVFFPVTVNNTLSVSPIPEISTSEASAIEPSSASTLTMQFFVSFVPSSRRPKCRAEPSDKTILNEARSESPTGTIADKSEATRSNTGASFPSSGVNKI